jgi:hypothetical protein
MKKILLTASVFALALPTAALTGLPGEHSDLPYVSVYHPSNAPVGPDWDIWNSETALPQNSIYHCGEAVDVGGTWYVYIFGLNDAAPVSTVYRYNTATDTWETMSATLPTAYTAMASAYDPVNNYIYLAGGYATYPNGTTTFWAYDVAADSFITTFAQIPTGLHRAGMEYFPHTTGDVLYLVGGQTASGILSSTSVYDIGADTWTAGTNYPITNRTYALRSTGTVLIGSCGYDGSFLANTYVGVPDGADPTIITWNQGTNCPIAFSRPGNGAMGEYFFILGGEESGTGPHGGSYFYNWVQDTWTAITTRPSGGSNVWESFAFVGGDSSIYCSGSYVTAPMNVHNSLDCTSPPPIQADHDVATVGVAVPQPGEIYAGLAVDPEATCMNIGNNTESFDFILTIYENAIPVYYDTHAVASLPPMGSEVAVFDQFTIGADGNVYDFEFYTDLVGDEDPTNDTMAVQVVSSTWWTINFEADDGGFTRTGNTSNPAAYWTWGNVDPCGATAPGPGNGANWWYCDSDAGGSGVTVRDTLWSQMYDFSAATYCSLRFYIDYNYLGGDNVTVRASSDGGATWTQITQFSADITGVQGPYPLDLFVGSATCQIQFTYSAGWDWGVVIDDFGFKPQPVVDVDDEPLAVLPTCLILHTAFPNPFNPTTTIAFDLPSASSVRLEIYNVLGQRVTTLIDGELPAGSHSIAWDASNVGSGVYFARLVSDIDTATTKMTLLK